MFPRYLLINPKKCRYVAKTIGSMARRKNIIILRNWLLQKKKTEVKLNPF